MRATIAHVEEPGEVLAALDGDSDTLVDEVDAAAAEFDPLWNWLEFAPEADSGDINILINDLSVHNSHPP